MRIGIGLPNTTPGGAAVLTTWARRAEAGPFDTVAVLDRLVYDSVDPFTALAAAAAVTERVRLATMIAIGPLRSPGLLAKLAGSVDALSGGRLVLGLGVGAREDDYRAAGVELRGRGAALSARLADLRTRPDLRADLPVLVGGGSGLAFARMARYADGYAHGGGPPRAFASAAGKARAAWTALGRPGRPQLWGQGYVALTDPERGAAYLRDYYAFTGPFAARVAAGALTTPGQVREFVRGYQDAGCDQLVLFPTVSDPAELDRLAEVLS